MRNRAAIAPHASSGLDFRAIYEAHVTHVWRVLKRLGVVERDLEDATHEVFVVAHRKLGEFDASRPVRPWLTGIAYRVASDERRRARHRREQMSGEAPLEAREDERASPEAAVADEQARALVAQGLEALSMDQRIVFVMHELDEATGREIAEALEIPLFTVYSRLRAARKRFKVEIIRLTKAGG